MKINFFFNSGSFLTFAKFLKILSHDLSKSSEKRFKKKKEKQSLDPAEVPVSKCLAAGNVRRRPGKKERNTTIRISAMRKYTIGIRRGMNSGRLSSPPAERRHGRERKKGRGAGEGQVLAAPPRLYPGPLRGLHRARASAPKASCFSQRDEDIYIPLSFRPRLGGNPPVSYLPILSLSLFLFPSVVRMRKRRSLGGCE